MKDTSNPIRKTFSWFLALVMLLHLVSGAAFAAPESGNVASVTPMRYDSDKGQYVPDGDPAEYESVETAFQNAQEYSVVTLLEDVTVDGVLTVSTYTNLDLNGHTMTVTQNGSISGSGESGSLHFDSEGSNKPGTFRCGGTVDAEVTTWTGDTFLFYGARITKSFSVDGGTISFINSEVDFGEYSMINNGGPAEIDVTVSGTSKIRQLSFIVYTDGAGQLAEGVQNIRLNLCGGYFDVDPQTYERGQMGGPSDYDQSQFVNYQKDRVQQYSDQNDWDADHETYSWRIVDENTYEAPDWVGGSGGGQGGNPDPGGDPPQTPAVQSIALSVDGVAIDPEAGGVALTLGQNAQFTAAITPADAVPKTTSWRINDTTVATVSDTGLVTPLKAGHATLRYTADSVWVECGVNVRSNAVTITGVKVVSKGYDGTTDAQLDFADAVLSGVQEGDDVSVSPLATGTFDTAEIGTDKTVTLQNLGITGKDSGSYTFDAENSQKTAPGTITKADRALSLAPEQSGTLVLYAGDTGSVALAVTHDADESAAGAIRAVSSVDGVVTVGQAAKGADETYLVSLPYGSAGYTDVTFTLAGTTNYNASTNSVTVTVNARSGYDVKVASGITGGTVTADRATANAGDPVSVTVKPKVGYELEALTVTNVKTDAAVTVADGRFTMPAGNVTVGATFTQTNYTLTYADVEGVAYAAGLPDAAHYGDAVTLSASSTDGNKAVNGFQYSYGATTVAVAPDKEGACTFKMPAQNITVTALSSDLYDVSVAAGLTNGALAVSKAKAAAGEVITVTPTVSDGYVLGAVTYNDSPVVVSASQEGPVFTFVMPAQPVTVSAVFLDPEVLSRINASAGTTQGKTEAEVAIAVDETTMTALQRSADAVSVELPAVEAPQNVAAQDAVAALAQAGLVQVTEEGVMNGAAAVESVRVVEKTYMDVSVTDYEVDGEGNVILTMDITPMRQTVATVAEEEEQLDSANTVPLSTAEKMTVNGTTTVTVGIPDNLAEKAGGNGGTLYIRHAHEGKTYEYRAAISGSAGSYTATFTNPNGYSEFTLSAQSDTVASYTDGTATLYYPSLKEAVADAIAAGVYAVTVHRMPTADGDKAVISAPVTLTFSAAAGSEDLISFDALLESWISYAPLVLASTGADLNAHRFIFRGYVLTLAGTPTLPVGGTVTLTPTLRDSDDQAVDLDGIPVTWSSDDTAVATVTDGGLVTGRSAGAAIITAEVTVGGQTARGELAVTVTAANSNGDPEGSATVSSGAASNSDFKLTEDGALAAAPEVKDGAARATADEGVMAKALEGAEALTLKVDTQGAGDVALTLAADGVKAAADAGVDARIETELGTVKLPAKALEALARSGKDAEITVKKNADGSATIGMTSGGKAVEGELKVELPAAGEGQTLAIVNADGTRTPVKKSLAEEGVVYAQIPAGATVAVTDNAVAFPDVTPDAWYAPAVEFVSSHGLFQGTGSGFSPDEAMTRAMLVTVLYRLEGAAASGRNPFDDVEEGAWYTQAVIWANETGIVQGTGGGFKPGDPVTREQMATILFRYAKLLGLDVTARAALSGFADGQAVSAWAKEAMEWAVAQGLFQGDGNDRLDPKGDASRAEVAALLQRMVKLMVK